MAISDLNDLFESVDGLTEDLMEFGMMTGAAIASHMAFNAAVNFGLSKWANAPVWVSKYAVPGVAIVGGALAGGYAGRYVGKNVAQGVAVGLMLAGATRLIREFAPESVSQYLGAMEDNEISMNGLGSSEEVLLGVGDGGSAFDQYLNGATTSVEQVGMAPTSFETVNGFGVAASFQ